MDTKNQIEAKLYFLRHSSTETSVYEADTVSLDGKQYLLVPVVMMVEGVHSGSAGPLFHSAQTLAQSIDKWKGKPVTIDHPEQDGTFISAKNADQKVVVGFVKEAYFEDNKLKGHILLDQEKLRENYPDVLDMILNSTPMDVSIGVFTEEIEKAGVWNGEEYRAIAVNHQPDHLALLPNMEGACNWNDGCGLRVNNKSNNKSKENEMSKELETLMKQVNSNGFRVSSIGNALNEENPLNTNKKGYRELLSAVQNKLDSMDSGSVYHFLEELYEDYVIYVRRNSEDSTTQMFRQSYSYKNGTVELEGDPVQVVRKIEYETISTNKFKRNRPINNKNGKVMEKEKLIEELIANSQSKFTNCDREWLSSLSVNQLQDLMPKKEEKKEEPKLDVNSALAYLKTQELKDEDVLSLLSDNAKQAYQTGMELYKKQREELEKKVLANSTSFKEEELKEMDYGLLKKIADSFKEPGNYAGFAAGGQIEINDGLLDEDDDDVLVPVEL